MASDYQRVRAIYLEAVELPSSDRSALLDRACGGDAVLRSEVEGLLGYEDDPRSLRPATLPVTQADHEDPPLVAPLPATIGDYRVIRIIGQGGMGIVYEAEQESPHRTVALKVLRTAIDGPAARRRFQLEAELLGRLRHPGIAQIHEARFESDLASPFIVMEYVDGRAITTYADEEGLDADARLELLARVGDAIQHAHNQSLIHRDIKPGNILVDASRNPKVLDFGVARVLDDELRSATLATQVGQVVGTVSYMSPEQASGNPGDVDTRSDIYALGVLGYELLTGELPHDTRGMLLHEAVLAIRERPPVRPRTRRPALPNDVETILLKALETDKERRYQSADAMCEDIRRFSRREPIAAHPPSSFYQIRMFARRNRALVSGTVALLVVLVVGIVSTLVYAIRAEEAAGRERIAKERAASAAAQERVQRERAERVSYAAQMRAIAAAVDAGRAEEARRLLALTQSQRRGWEWHHHQARLDTCEVLFGQDDPLVDAVVFRDDGRELVTLSRSGKLTARSTATWDVVFERDLGPGLVAFSMTRDGQALATVHADGTLSLRRGEDEIWRDPLPEEWRKEAVGAVRIAPDGTRCLVEIGRRVVLWSPADGRLAPLTTSPYSTWSPDGARVAAGQMSLYDGRLGDLVARMPGEPEVLRTGAFDPSGRRVAFGSTNPGIYVMDVATGDRVVYIRARREALLAMAWIDDGETLVTGDAIGDVHVWDVRSGEFVRPLLGHRERVRALAVSPDGHLVAAAAGGEVRVWDLRHPRDGASEIDHGEVVSGVAVSPTGDLLVTGDRRGSIHLWDALTAEPLGILTTRLRGNPRGMGWSTDGTRIFASTPETVVLDALTGAPADGDVHDLAWPGRLGYGRGISPDGSLKSRGGRSGRFSLTIARTADDSVVASIDTTGFIFQTTFSPDGRWLAIAGQDGFVDIHECSDWGAVARLEGHSGPVNALDFSHDGTRLASGGQDRTIRIWETEHWSETAVLQGHGGDVQALTFSADDDRLISGSHDQTTRIWARVPRRVLVARAAERRREREARAARAAAPDGELLSAWHESGDHVAHRILLGRRAGSESARTLEDARTGGTPGSRFGHAMTLVPGATSASPHVVVGSPHAGPTRSGLVEVLTETPRVRRVVAHGANPGEELGAALAGLDDLDGDGVPEVAVGAPGASGPAGRRTGALIVLTLAGDELHRIHGESEGERLGTFVETGDDYDGDGVRDIVVAGRNHAAVVRVVSARTGRTLRSWPLRRGGTPPFAIVGDADGDGISDLALVDSSDGVRLVSVATGAELGMVLSGSDDDTGTLCVRACADIDGDGMSDFFVARQGSPPRNRRRAKERRTVELRLSGDGTARWQLERGPVTEGALAPRLRLLPDLDGDGTPELAVWSAKRVRRRAQDDPALSIVSGATGRVLEEIPTPQDAQIGFAMAAIFADLDRDGFLDAIVASPDTEPPYVETRTLATPAPDPARR